VRFNNGTLASVSQIALDDLDKNGVDQSAFIALFDDSTNTIKGTLVFRTSGGDIATFSITGLTDNSGWNQIAVTHVASSGTFANGEDTFIGFTRAGDKGADGEGSGDVIGPASSTDNTVARYNSTTGKLLQGSGVTIDDSNNVGAASLTLTTDLAVAHGGTGASDAAGARSNISAAALGANSDITSLTGLTTDLSVAQGGTGASTFAANGILYGAGTGAIAATAVGTANQVLTSNGSGVAPTFQDAAGGGATTLLTTVNASSASNVQFTSNIDSTYKKYIIVGNSITNSADNTNLSMTFSFNGGSTYQSSLYSMYSIYSDETTSGHSTFRQNETTSSLVMREMRTGTHLNSNFTMEIYNPAYSGYTFHSWKASYPGYLATQVFYQNGSGMLKIAGAVNAIKYAPASGTISGTFKLYGIS